MSSYSGGVKKSEWSDLKDGRGKESFVLEYMRTGVSISQSRGDVFKG